MKRFTIGLLIAVVAIVMLAGIAVASGGASPSAQGKGESAKVQQAWLGMSIANVDKKTKEHFNLTVDAGVVVTSVAPDGAAHSAGLKPGDVIQAINGTKVQTVDQVTSAIQASSPGTAVTLTVLRGSEVLTIKATLAARPEPPVPSDLIRLLSSALSERLLHADYQILGTDNKPVTIGVTLGTVQSVTDAGVLNLVRKDGLAVKFQTTANTKVVVGGHIINLAGLKAETPVVVIEKAGSVELVMGWPGDVMHQAKPMTEGREKPKPPHAFVQPFSAPPMSAKEHMRHGNGLDEADEDDEDNGMLHGQAPDEVQTNGAKPSSTAIVPMI